jgi:hypothetical protein
LLCASGVFLLLPVK